MKPSTWNDTNQHWISQFLLKGFGIKGHSSKTYQLDKKTGIIEIRRVADVASMQRLLTDRDDELMKSIEQRTRHIIGSIRKRNYNLTKRDKLALDDLTFALICNDPKSGFDKETSRARVIGNVSAGISEAIARQGGLVNNEVLENLIEARFSRDYLTIAMNRNDNLALKALNHMEVRVYVPEDGEAFVVGDSPVLIVRGTDKGVSHLFNAGSQIILPVHSRCMLFYTWESSPNLPQSGTVLDQEQVKSLNKDYCHGSNSRHIFARTSETLIEASKPREVPNTEPLFAAEADGWTRMHSEIIGNMVIKATKDKQYERALNSLAHDVVRRSEAALRGKENADL